MEYQYPQFTILMPDDHTLGICQAHHRLYDRFLPHLAKYLPESAIVVDVGANVGDTLAAMYSTNPRLDFICIEPNDHFFSLLQTNVDRIRAIDAHASINMIKCFVGAPGDKVGLEGSAYPKQALDDLLKLGAEKSLALIKSDVDGFDYDVINSAITVIEAKNPLLFFECQFEHEFQKDAYVRLMQELPTRGYDQFTVFDNFGEVMFQTNKTADLLQLFNYVWRQNVQRTTRTVYYYDILVSSKHHKFVSACIADYLCLNMPS
jgi:FkbM family methyltransferase